MSRSHKSDTRYMDKFVDASAAPDEAQCDSCQIANVV